MKLKIFLTACVSLFLISFPQNMIGCGPDVDPYDYYTSFFQAGVHGASAYKPFYYSGYVFLYDESEPVSSADELAKEWAAFCGSPVTEKDAKSFVMEFSVKDVRALYNNIEKKQTTKIPDSVQRNSMTAYFADKKDLEGLGYIIYAKQVEPFVAGDYNTWEPIQRDSVKMDKWLKNGQQLYNAAKDPFYKLKYGYQVLRLAHYSNRFEDAIKLYDTYVAGNNTNSVLQPMSLALKAGALFRSGNTKEAAYLFSNAFAAADVKKVSNYISFNWAVDSQKDKAEYLALCKTKEEKANMLAMFALGSSGPEINSMKEIFAISPSAKVLQVLAVREINKLEESYYTPSLNKQAGGKPFYYTWQDEKSDSILTEGSNRTHELQAFLHNVAASGKSGNDGLFETGAAYCALMTRDFRSATELLDAADKMKLSSKVKDQWLLTNLLLAINETEKVDAAFEKRILPSIQWLQQKAITEKKDDKSGWYSNNSDWQIFYRNLMSEVIAKRYHQQGDIYKEALAVGAADRNTQGGEENYYSQGVEFMRSNMEGKDVRTLYNLMQSKTNTAFETFLVKNNAIKLRDVIDFAGTAYLRDNNFSEAISWFAKAGSKPETISKNPFIELLYDQEERLSFDKVKTTKLAFATEMKRLDGLSKTDKVNAAKHLYKMGLGFYNTTYYGYTWELVEYSRSGSDGYYIPEGANNFKKNYYGCYNAHDYFKMAMDKSTDANFKAKCLFMMAKCAQKQVRRPQYSDFGYNTYEKYEEAEKEFWPKFKNNRYFPQLVQQYGKTLFYEEAYSTCSFLSDFVEKK